MLKELEQHISRGEADDLIVQDFVQEYGMQVLSAPPNSGFNRLAWLMPGLRFRWGWEWWCSDCEMAPEEAGAPAPQRASAEVLQRAREMADRETEE